MSASGIPSPTRGSSRHIHRSITDLTSPVKKHHTHTSHHHPTAHVSASLHHKRERSRDDRKDTTAPHPAAQMAPRASLEVPRSEAVTPATNLSASQSPRGSVLIPVGVESGSGGAMVPPSREGELRKNKEKAEARTTGLKKSLADLATTTTTTTRRLDDTYYSVLQKLTSLQNTISSLADLARESTNTNECFIAESQSVVTDAQAQLDGFGDFSEQQARVQALQDRVRGGQERIAALSARVDIVRHRVEGWERADREWQERTRKRLRIVWGVVLGLGLVLLLLHIGARAYAPKLEELREDAMLAKMRLEGVIPGSRAGAGGARTARLNFSWEGKAESGDEALRALDEL